MLLQTIVLINTALKTLLEQMLRFERHATRSGLELTYSVMVGGGVGTIALRAQPTE